MPSELISMVPVLVLVLREPHVESIATLPKVSLAGPTGEAPVQSTSVVNVILPLPGGAALPVVTALRILMSSPALTISAPAP